MVRKHPQEKTAPHEHFTQIWLTRLWEIDRSAVGGVEMVGSNLVLPWTQVHHDSLNIATQKNKQMVGF